MYRCRGDTGYTTALGVSPAFQCQGNCCTVYLSHEVRRGSIIACTASSHIPAIPNKLAGCEGYFPTFGPNERQPLREVWLIFVLLTSPFLMALCHYFEPNLGTNKRLRLSGLLSWLLRLIQAVSGRRSTKSFIFGFRAVSVVVLVSLLWQQAS